MTCYHPISLKRKEYKSGHLIVPCGRCIGCRLEHSRQAAVRCMHEAATHDHNQFITLTYSDGNLPWGGYQPTLVPGDLQLFWKRLRKEYGNGIKYYACGEYGERTCRPHYHACVFGLDIKDKTLYDSKAGNNYYASDTLDSIWGLGHCIIGDVTFESAAYVSRYIIGKKTGDDASIYIERGIEPEFVRMSRRPGIGKNWLDKYQGDVFPRDSLRVRGVKCKPPRYYLKKFEERDPVGALIIKLERAKKAEETYFRNKELNAPKLDVQERVKKSQIKTLTRGQF